jgi:hypothetical protein
VWWGYGVCGVLAALATVVVGFMVVARFAEIAGKPIAAPERGSVTH